MKTTCQAARRATRRAGRWWCGRKREQRDRLRAVSAEEALLEETSDVQSPQKETNTETWIDAACASPFIQLGNTSQPAYNACAEHTVAKRK